MVLPVLVVVVLFVALLLSYPWEVLTLGTLIYLASLPIGFLAYRRYEQADAAGAHAKAEALSAGEAARPGSRTNAPPSETPETERPARLN
jgi:CDP-diacylglycerol--serine O-phosphatidyltransferase